MRSILFVPATRPELVGKAAGGEASAICLDLEDGVAPDQKDASRAHVAEAVAQINAAGKTSALRINSNFAAISFDLAVVPQELDYIVLPMAASRHQIRLLADWADEAFGDAGPKFVAMVEGADGVRGLISDNRPLPARLTHIALGSEDFAASQGCTAASAPVRAGFEALAHFAAEWGLQLLGYPGSIAEFRDLDAFAEKVRVGLDGGSVGGFAIHPKQVAVLNEVFAVSDADTTRARRIVETFESALSEGRGAIQLDGKMVDKPIYLAAQRLLARA